MQNITTPSAYKKIHQTKKLFRNMQNASKSKENSMNPLESWRKHSQEEQDIQQINQMITENTFN